MKNISDLSISADCDRVEGNFFIPMPAGVLMSKLLDLKG